MFAAKVTGRVWCTKRLPELPPGCLLEVLVEGVGSKLIAFDPLGCADGERVIVATGSVAGGWFAKNIPIDALVIGSIDEPAAS